jgi:hypothetical protein
VSPFGPGRYGAFVAIVAVALIVYVTIDGAGTRAPGAGGLRAGERLPPFAALLATAGRSCGDDDPCDANVAREADSDDQAGPRPACSVRGREILNVCQLAERGPVVLAFIVSRGGCAEGIDALAGVARRHPGVQVAAVGVRGDRDDLRDLVRERGWRFPVAWDRDGTVAALYGVATCPQTVFARYRGGAVSTSFDDLRAADLERRVRRIERASRRLGWRPPAR